MTSWGAESAVTGKCKYGNGKYEIAWFLGLENTSTAKISMNLQVWKMWVWKMQVLVCSDGKRKYGKYKYMFAEPTLQLPSINELN